MTILLLMLFYLCIGFLLSSSFVRIDEEPLDVSEYIFCAVAWPILVAVTVFDRKEK